MFKKIRSWFRKKEKVVPEFPDPAIVEALDYAYKKLKSDPSHALMTTAQLEKEVIEWAGHYLREKKRLKA